MSARKMKDSGIEWIGEIPEEWEIRKLKYATICNGEALSESTEADYAFDYIDIGSVLYEGGITNTLEVTFETAPSRARRVVHENDVIISTVRTYLKAIAYIDKKYESAICSTGFAVFSPKKGYDGRFLYYSLSANWFVSSVESISTGISYPAVSSIAMGDLKSIFPPFAEQKAIAVYLDEKCAAIDQIVASKQKQNEQLAEYRQSLITQAVTKGLNPSAPMKDSGIEWIGEIPEEWQILPLKYILKYPLQYGATETGEDYVDGYPRYIRITDIDSNNNLKEENQKYLNFKDASPFILNDGDILFARSGATVGKTFLYLAEYGKAAFAGYLIRASVNTDVAFSKFIYYYTFSYSYDYWKNMIFSQATIQNIGADKYSVIDVPLPPLAEQKAIAAYLDKKCDEIDALSKRNKNIIESLQEYKQSLIYEAVTGKIEL